MKKGFVFSKEESLALKGVAIILLVWHHCFCSPERFEGYEVITFLNQGKFISLSEHFRLCVSMFAFISGYGLYVSARKECQDGKTSNQWVIVRLLKTLSGFWFVYVISFILMQILTGLPERLYFKKGFLHGIVYAGIDFLGLSELFGTPELNGSWWYMSAAIVFIVIMPLMVKGIEKTGIFSAAGAVLIFPRIITNNEFQGTSSPYSILLAVIMGLIFARYNLFAKFFEMKIVKKSRIANEIIIFAGLLAIMYVNAYIWIRVPYEEIWEYHLGIVPVFVILFCVRFIFKIPMVKPVLQFFGRHSMNIFLVHTFLRKDLLKDFVYSFQYPVMIVVVLFTISLLISIVIEYLKKVLHYDAWIAGVCAKISA